MGFRIAALFRKEGSSQVAVSGCQSRKRPAAVSGVEDSTNGQPMECKRVGLNIFVIKIGFLQYSWGFWNVHGLSYLTTFVIK